MHVTVKFYGPVNALSKGNIQSLELPVGTTVIQLIEVMQKETGITADTFLQQATLLVNMNKSDLNTILNDGDKVIIVFTLSVEPMMRNSSAQLLEMRG